MAQRLPAKGATERPDNDIWLQLESQFYESRLDN